MCENYRAKPTAPAAPTNFKMRPAAGDWDLYKEGMAVTQPLDDRVREALTRSQVIDMTTTGRTSGEARRVELAMHNLGRRQHISCMPFRQRPSGLAHLDA